MQIAFREIAGVKTRCLIAGDPKAYPLLLLHGLLATGDVWLRNIDSLAERYFVIAPDMLGHGFTDPGKTLDSPLTNHKVKHLCNLLDEFRLNEFCAVGSSYGALLAVLLYFERPQRMNRLILNGSGSVFNSEEQLKKQIGEMYRTSWPVLGTSTPQMWRETLARAYYDPKKVPPELLHLLPTCYAHSRNLSSWQQTVLEMLDIDGFRAFRVSNRLEEIKVKTLIVWGREDPGASYESAVVESKRIPNATFETFNQCGHLPFSEHPVQYNETVRRFLNGL